MQKQSKPQQSNAGKNEPANRRLTGAEIPSQDNRPESEKRNILEIFKNKPDGKTAYTDPDYEVPPGESDGVHIQAEVRTFDRDGNILSKPQILKFGDREWVRWHANRNVTGYSINKVLHRPSNIEPFDVDEWRGPKPEGR